MTFSIWLLLVVLINQVPVFVAGKDCVCISGTEELVYRSPDMRSPRLDILSQGECVPLARSNLNYNRTTWVAVIVRHISCRDVHCIHGHCINDTCQCNFGFSGVRCDQCGGTRCINGVCLSYLNPAICYCDNGKTGHTCEIDQTCPQHGISAGGICYTGDTKCSMNVCSRNEYCFIINGHTICSSAFLGNKDTINQESIKYGCERYHLRDIKGNCVDISGIFTTRSYS